MADRYHQIPNYRQQAGIALFTIFAYGLLLCFSPFTVTDISPAHKRGFGQFWLFIVYFTGLLGGLGFFWNSKVEGNIVLANGTIKRCDDGISLLTSLHRETGIDFEHRIKILAKEKSEATEQLNEAKNFPRFLNHTGIASIVLLAIGTLLQVISLT
ncbi:Uncharacterised protein [Burkholderia pseudomallei]|nr:Uncharacterised protein [Burkholderia pseudomallei]CAJ5899712.1 Uncharacterised protein [Burkholderia pseudomallei]